MRLRVLVYNVRGFRAGVDRVVAAVAEHRPDVALVQECDSRRRLGRFARGLEMEAVSTRLFPLRRQVRNAVLVRPPWRVVSFRLHRFDRSQRFYPRGVLLAVVGRSGYRITAMSVHLGLAPGERARHARELGDVALGAHGPALIGGDLNEGPEGKAASWVAARFWDTSAGSDESPAPTFPSVDPTVRIDYLFASERFRVDRSRVLDTPETREASDHLPLVVDIEVDGG